VYARAVNLRDKVIVVTGGAHGIGRALVERFAREAPRTIVVADRDLPGAEAVAAAVGGSALACDVAKEDDLVALVRRTEAAEGRIDLFCSNAGIGVGEGVETPDEVWRTVMDVNFMAHVWAARAVLPGMIARGGGYLLQTASAAGLLSMIGSAPYAVSKHAAVALAEWLAITHGDQGIRVSCLCPLGVNTELLRGALTTLGGQTIAASGAVLEPAQVADAVVAGLEAERFLILPHPEVQGFYQKKAADHDRWIVAMRRLQAAK
jgi:NAD(P)-dependent dehydrogenase (short-subunit alcohol dehydrogenase family)